VNEFSEGEGPFMEQDKNNRLSAVGFPDAELKRSIEGLPIRILIVEDDSSIRLLLEKTLSQENYEVFSAGDGEEAWQMIQSFEEPPNIVVLDWMMPKMDGLALCKKIKEQESPFVFTVMLTAKATDEDIIAALRAGADEFLTKPFNLDVLRSRIAAGARIVRLEALLSLKNSILEYYIEKTERASAPEARPSGEKAPV
jgi:DNA-binding response OmpR family regulator